MSGDFPPIDGDEAALAEHLADAVVCLSSDSRLLFWEALRCRICTHCWLFAPGCQCWNDE